MLIEIRRDEGYHSLFVDGQKMVDRETMQVCDNIAESLMARGPVDSEAAEVAAAIAGNLSPADYRRRVNR